MASPQQIDAFIAEQLENVRDGSFRLVVRVENKGGALSFVEGIGIIDAIREAVAVSAANYIFVSWLFGKIPADGQRLFYLNDYLNYLSLLPNITSANGEFFALESENLLVHSRRLAYGLGTYFDHPLRGIELHVYLDQIYHENPNWFKILFAGNGLVAAYFAMCFIIQTAYQTFGASDCRNAYLKYGQRQTDMIFGQARLQGKMTPELRDSYDAALKSSISAAESCNKIFNSASVGIGGVTVTIEKK